MHQDNRRIFEGLIKSRQIRIELGELFDNGPGPVPDSFDSSRVEGMMLGIAIADALGNTSEGMPPSERHALYGEIRDYLPNRHAGNQAVGLPSDNGARSSCAAIAPARVPGEIAGAPTGEGTCRCGVGVAGREGDDNGPRSRGERSGR